MEGLQKTDAVQPTPSPVATSLNSFKVHERRCLLSKVKGGFASFMICTSACCTGNKPIVTGGRQQIQQLAL